MPMKKLNMLSFFVFSIFISLSCSAQYYCAACLSSQNLKSNLHENQANVTQTFAAVGYEKPELSLIDDKTPNPAGTSISSGLEIKELNNKSVAQSYPWLSDDGLRLYYTNGESMFMASRSAIGQKFSGQHEIVKGIKNIIISGWLTPDELTIYFADQNNQLFKSSRSDKSLSFTTAVKVSLINAPEGSLFDATFTPDMKELLMYSNTTTEQIVKFEKTGSDEYTYKGIVNLISPNIPTGGQLSRDGLRFYVPMKSNNNGNSDYRTLYVLTRTGMHGEFEKIEPLASVENITCDAYQPCVNADESRCVFVTGKDNLWENNDLCEVSLIKVIQLTKNEIPAEQINKTIDLQTAFIEQIDHKILKIDKRYIPEPATLSVNTGDANATSFTNTIPVEKAMLEMTIAPNPVVMNTKIEVLSPVDGHMTISIYSQTGQLVSTVYDGQAEKGIHIFSWARNLLSNGIYTVRTVVEKNVVTKKIVVCGDIGPQ
jgi:hypothetical protein